MKIYYYGNKQSDTILIQPVDEHDLEEMEAEVTQLRTLMDQQGASNKDFLLAAVKVNNWNGDLAPWNAPPVWGTEGFAGNAPATLDTILNDVIPQIGDRRYYYIGGYSLAGLFALWAITCTNCFAGAAAASPSVWFPGFGDYFSEAMARRHTESPKNPAGSSDKHAKSPAIYLSLGDKEEKTKNQTMAQVGDQIRRIHAILINQGVDTTLEWNPGNHFRDSALRTAKAFAWLLTR